MEAQVHVKGVPREFSDKSWSYWGFRILQNFLEFWYFKTSILDSFFSEIWLKKNSNFQDYDFQASEFFRILYFQDSIFSISDYEKKSQILKKKMISKFRISKLEKKTCCKWIVNILEFFRTSKFFRILILGFQIPWFWFFKKFFALEKIRKKIWRFRIF